MVRQASNTAGLTPPTPQRSLRTAPGDADTGVVRILGLRASHLLTLFLVLLLLPAQFQIGPVRLTPYVLLILVCAIPLLQRFLADASNRIVALDVIVALYVLWIGLAILYNHGPARIVFVANQTITVFGGYLVGRILVRSEADYRQLFKTILVLLAVLAPFALLEMLTRRMLPNDILGLVMTVNPRATNEMRMGLNRVQTIFAHPILFGLFCSIALANFYYLYRRSLVWAPAVALASVLTFVSLSSAPNISMLMQYGLIAWERLTRLLPGRWIVLILAGLGVVATLQISFEGGLVGFVIETLAFNPMTGWGRTEIFEYGSAEVLRNPVFGLGLGEWVRPWWRKSSVDNFWLLTAMRYGLPTLFFLWLGLLVHGLLIVTRRDLDEGTADCRNGYLFSWIGLCFVLGTVFVWGPLSVFVMIYLGAGAWFYTSAPAAAAAPVRRAPRSAPETEHPARASLPPPERAARPAPHFALEDARRRRRALRPDEGT